MVLLVAALVIPFVAAGDTSQKYGKIYLDPFYRSGMNAGVVYQYNLTVDPPDGVSRVDSAIITLQAYINPTRTFSIWVDGVYCNTANYTVSTTYAGAGQGTMTFDCTNRITKAGRYNVTMLITGGNIGSATMWADLTYMNKPAGSIDVHGTEYYENDDGTLFIQVRDADGNAVSNASCAISIFYPNLPNQMHVAWIDKGAMMYLGRDGIYYYDFTTPPLSGLYMAEATCYYDTDQYYYYSESDPAGPVRTAITGSYVGDSFVLNAYSDWLYTECTSAIPGGGSGRACDAMYDFVVGTNITKLDVRYLGESTGSPTMNMSVWNWTGNKWATLPNILTYHSSAGSGVPSGIDEYVSNSIDASFISPVNRSVRIRLNAWAGSNFKIYSNWLTLSASRNSGLPQDIKGSGEVHVSSVTPESLNGRFYKITSCNGEVDGRCAFATNDDEFDFPEGELEDYINLSAVSTRTGTQIDYQTPFTVDCAAIYWIKEWNGSNWTDFSSYSLSTDPGLENCKVTLEKDISAGNEYEFWIKMDNFMKWEVDYTMHVADAIHDFLDGFCLDRNFTYINPIVDGTPTSDDKMTDQCHQAYDDLYWVNTYYNDSLEVTSAGDYTTYVQEMRFYREEMYNKYMYLTLGNKSIAALLNRSEGAILNMSSRVDEIHNATLDIQNKTSDMQTQLSGLQLMMNDIWTWVSGIFTWVQTDNDQNASTTTASVSLPAQLSFMDSTYREGSPGTVLVQLMQDGSPIGDASCSVKVYWPNMTVQVNEPMAYTDEGIYSYAWSVPYSDGLFPTIVNCTGGSVSGQVRASGSLQVQSNVGDLEAIS